ncbi:MAG: class I SAM-dependent methyltransferase [Candidatus Bipolaricaulia bacterium]
MEDKKTTNYFDNFTTPVFPVARYSHTIDTINRYCQPGASLIDIGCGNGNTLQFIRDNTPVEKLVGMDVSKNYLAQVNERLRCDTALGSILDSHCIATMGNKFDFAVMGAVLHHLVGRTRKESRRRAKQAIKNALQLLKNGGHLIIYEPVFYPSWLMSIVFYLKSFMTRLTSGRAQLFAKWANIGMPVVSFYTNEQLIEMIDETAKAELIGKEIKDSRQLAFIICRTKTTLVIRKV